MTRWKIDIETLLPADDNPLGNRFYGYRKLGLTLPDGRDATYHGVVVSDCVHTVALEADGTTYLVEQSRPNIMPVGGKEVPKTLELPGGFAKPGQTMALSAQNELAEIRKHAGTLTPVGILLPSVGISNEHDHIFMGTNLSPIDSIDAVEATEQDLHIVTGKFGKLYGDMLRDRLPVSAQTLAAMAKVAILL